MCFLSRAETEYLVQRQRLGFKDSDKYVLRDHDKIPSNRGLDEVPDWSVSVWGQWGERKGFALVQPSC